MPGSSRWRHCRSLRQRLDGHHDITFGPDDSLYVLEIVKHGLLAAFGMGDWTGALICAAEDGTRTEIASEGLFAPGGVALGEDGAFYVTNNSIFSSTGEVVKVVP